MILNEQRDKAIKNLNLPKSLLKLIEGEFVHEDLEFRFNPLSYSLESEDFSPSGLDVTPLWESDSSITGFYLKEDKPIFITYYVDDMDDFKTIGESVDELIEYLVVEYGEDEDELRGVLKG